MSDTEEILARAGLELTTGVRLDYPMLIQDGDEAWLTAVHNGVRIRLCKVPPGRLLGMVAEGASIAKAILPR